jgi:lysophospholipase L1-like esterase
MQSLLPIVMALAALVPARAQQVATTPVPRTDEGILARQAEVLRRARESAPAAVVFLGDSITQGWEDAGRAVWERELAPLGALNLGVSGDRTEHVLWRLQEASLARLAPRVVVILIGTNNLGHGSSDAEGTLAGVRAVLARVREQAPAAQVLLLEIFPRGERMNPMRGDIAQVNQALRAHPPERVRTLALGDRWVNADGTLSREVLPDLLHLSERGYREWAEGLVPALREALAAER